MLHLDRELSLYFTGNFAAIAKQEWRQRHNLPGE